MMWLCAWTINHGQNNLTDHWLIHSGRHAVVDWVSEIVDTVLFGQMDMLAEQNSQ